MSDKLGLYGNLSSQVYELSKPTISPNVLNFYKFYAKEANGPILEAMCGNGRLMMPLIEEGLEVHGLDASKDMLKHLHNKAASKNLKPRVIECFLNEMDLPDIKDRGGYALTMIATSSFCLIIDMQNVEDSLRKICEHTSEGGKLVFEILTLKVSPSKLNMWLGNVWHRGDGSFIIVNYMDLPIKDEIGTTIFRYELSQNSKIIETETEHFQLRLYDPKKLSDLLKKVGFKSVKLVKAFIPGGTPNENDVKIVMEAQK